MSIRTASLSDVETEAILSLQSEIGGSLVPVQTVSDAAELRPQDVDLLIELEERLGVLLVAHLAIDSEFTPPVGDAQRFRVGLPFRQLDGDQLRRIHAIEDELGIILLCFEDAPKKDDGGREI